MAIKKTFTAAQMHKMICAGETTAVGLVSAAFDEIANNNDELQAWAWLDRETALAHAAELDSLKQSGRTVGPLHGVPIGLKDIIDTAAMPSELTCGAKVAAVPVVPQSTDATTTASTPR